MRAMSLVCGVWMALAAALGAAQEAAAPPAVAPAATVQEAPAAPAGGASLGAAPYAPQIAPGFAQQAPQPAGVAPAPSPELQLLWQKLAQRDALQQEIDALRESTRTPEQVIVHVQMLEVHLTKLREMGLEMTWNSPQGPQKLNADSFGGAKTQSVNLTTVDNQAFLAKFIDMLLARNAAKVLSSPTIATVSGRPAKFNVGGEIPIARQPAGQGDVQFIHFGTQVDLLATTLGDNRLRLEVRPRVAELDEANGREINGQKLPAVRVRECDTGCELEFGQALALMGLVEERVEVVRRALGRVEQVKEIGLLVVVTPEAVAGPAAPQAAGGFVQPASASGPYAPPR
jgi:hypothetical protein